MLAGRWGWVVAAAAAAQLPGPLLILDRTLCGPPSLLQASPYFYPVGGKGESVEVQGAGWVLAAAA